MSGRLPDGCDSRYHPVASAGSPEDSGLRVELSLMFNRSSFAESALRMGSSEEIEPSLYSSYSDQSKVFMPSSRDLLMMGLISWNSPFSSLSATIGVLIRI